MSLSLSFQLLTTVLCLWGPVAAVKSAPTEISTLAELAQAAARSGQHVKMTPGVYHLRDLVAAESIPERRKQQQWQYLTFSGSDNVFDLRGVTLELDTSLRERLHAPIHTDEFLITGSHVTLEGLTITSIGQGKAYQGAVLGLRGAKATLKDCTIHVEGSAPYGYGDLFGKGGMKHSGVHITGSGARLMGCRVFSRAFGHAFYLQEDCTDVVFENCTAEGQLRSSTDMLAETRGLAFDRQFQMAMLNRSGTHRILPGYVKALCEDGFRTYGTHRGLVLKNCTARHMRGGFELRTKSAPVLENCTAYGCERGFWVSDGAVLKRCRGDAAHGPLLYVEGSRAKVEMQLLPTVDDKATVHVLAAMYGTDNSVTLTAKGQRKPALPLLISQGPPPMGENMSINPEKPTRGLRLNNQTTMPVLIGSKAQKCDITTRGPVADNRGSDITITQVEP